MFNSRKYFINKLVNEEIRNKLNEAKGIKSKKIYDAIAAHGGISKEDIIHKVCDLRKFMEKAHCFSCGMNP